MVYNLEIIFIGYNKFITLGLIAALAAATFFFVLPYFDQDEVPEGQENGAPIEEEEEEEIEEVTYPQAISLTSTERMEFIIFLLENDVYSMSFYENTNEMSTSIIAHKFINWETNPDLTEAQQTFILDNYELDDYAAYYLDKYIPYSVVEDYIERVTGQTPTTLDSSGCMVYIEEYEAYVHVGGHGWWGGSVTALSFGDEGGQAHMFYPERLIQLGPNQYMFEVIQYRLKPEHETLDSKTLLEKFILGEYNATQAKIEIEDTVYYLMKKDGDQWQFVAHKETSFEE